MKTLSDPIPENDLSDWATSYFICSQIQGLHSTALHNGWQQVTQTFITDGITWQVQNEQIVIQG